MDTGAIGNCVLPEKGPVNDIFTSPFPPCSAAGGGRWGEAGNAAGRGTRGSVGTNTSIPSW